MIYGATVVLFHIISVIDLWLGASSGRMQDTLYDDDKCTYCWGDPRLDKRFVSGRLILTSEGVRFESDADAIVWPKAAIRTIVYTPTHPVDLDEIARSSGIDAAQDIAVGLSMDQVPELALSFAVDDPEGVVPDGFDIRILFRNEYFAKVFAKRASTALGVTFVGDDQ